MNTGLITVYNSFLYYGCLVLIAYYILEGQLRIKRLILSSLVFLPLTVLALQGNDDLLAIAHLGVEIYQFFAIMLSFKNIKVRYLVFVYIALYCINVIFASPIASLFPEYYLHIDAIINTTTVGVLAMLCFARTRYTVQKVLIWTPKYILVVTGFLLVIATVTSEMISFYKNFDFPDMWNQWLQVFIAFLLMAICVVVPIIFMISISNTQLKTLTSDYEQQIHAQAEHYKELAEVNFEARRFRHDFKNMSIAIEALMAEGKYDQALQLISQCNDTLKNPGGKLTFDTGNGIADALLADKQTKAAVCGAQVCFEGMIPSRRLAPTDLCVILGNTLDNAIEACQKLPETVDKTIYIKGDCKGGFLFLTIQNPIGERVVIRDNRIATTKDNKTLHGFGLYSLHSVIKKYDGEIKLSATEECFTVDIDLCLAVS